MARPAGGQQRSSSINNRDDRDSAVAGTLIAGSASGENAAALGRLAPQLAPPVQPAPAPASASSSSAAARLSVTAGTEFLASSSYVWRGFQPNSSFSVQPNTWVKIGNLTVSSWMNIARRHVEHRPVTEHDFTVDYSMTRGSWTYTAGWINYVFPEVETGRYSNEIYAGVSHGSYLSPTLRMYQDVHAGSGTYVNLGISHTYPVLRPGMSLMPSVALGYNHQQWIETSTFSDLNMGLRLTMPTPVKRLWVAPFINYSRSLDRDVLENKTFGGLSVAVR